MDPIDDYRNYKFRIFYFNPHDERVIVPKRLRVFGFTVNFARKEAALTVIAFVLLIVITMTLLARFSEITS